MELKHEHNYFSISHLDNFFFLSSILWVWQMHRLSHTYWPFVGFVCIVLSGCMTVIQANTEADARRKQTIATNLPGAWSELYQRIGSLECNKTKVMVIEQFVKKHKNIEMLTPEGYEMLMNATGSWYNYEINKILGPFVSLDGTHADGEKQNQSGANL